MKGPCGVLLELQQPGPLRLSRSSSFSEPQLQPAATITITRPIKLNQSVVVIAVEFDQKMNCPHNAMLACGS